MSHIILYSQFTNFREFCRRWIPENIICPYDLARAESVLNLHMGNARDNLIIGADVPLHIAAVAYGIIDPRFNFQKLDILNPNSWESSETLLAAAGTPVFFRVSVEPFHRFHSNERGFSFKRLLYNLWRRD